MILHFQLESFKLICRRWSFYLKKKILELSCLDIVNRFRVSTKLDFLLEGLVAELAGKRFHAGMFSHVRDQIRRLGEGF
jgi:hypothetical protein